MRMSVSSGILDHSSVAFAELDGYWNAQDPLAVGE